MNTPLGCLKGKISQVYGTGQRTYKKIGGTEQMSLCHFDIPAQNCDTLKQFYLGVFDWTFDKDKDSSEGWTIRFGSYEHPIPLTGSIVQRSAPTQPIGCYFRVASIDASSLKIQELGGTVFVPKTVVPGKGYYACCLDPEDNYFLIWEQDDLAT
jgi:predicted enzyme related to lactoylglutathione lyase